MMGGYGFGWGWMVLMPLVWILLIGLAVWGVVRLSQQSGRGGTPPGNTAGPPHRETPREILDRRLATGEIDLATYREARSQLSNREP